jgi:hypothetical protein
MDAMTTAWRTAALLTGAVVLWGCGSERGPRPLRQMTDSYYFTITPDQVPPRAREPILYKVLVRDKESRQPIESGEGQIYASNRDGAQTWDGLTKGPEIGTYHGKLHFVTAGDWAVAIRFRRDSTAKLEKTEWMQDVLPEREAATP